jgi:hypothetical protein
MNKLTLNYDYEKDFYAWIRHNVQLLRQGKLTAIDANNIAEELESMGRSEKRELVNLFAILLMHLLKWQYQPQRHGKSWKNTIDTKREDILELLQECPSLHHELPAKLMLAYKKARRFAENETDIDINCFPSTCPYALEQILNEHFYSENDP